MNTQTNTSDYAMFKHYNILAQKPLDELDLRILLLIFCGVTQCTHISAFVDITHQAVSKRLTNLVTRDFAVTSEQGVRSFRTTYSLSDYSISMFDQIIPRLEDINILFLLIKSKKLVASSVQ
jgi:hypothetical protein